LDAGQIGEKPRVYVLDTPGILVPNINNIDTGLKLALTGENLSFNAFCEMWIKLLQRWLLLYHIEFGCSPRLCQAQAQNRMSNLEAYQVQINLNI